MDLKSRAGYLLYSDDDRRLLPGTEDHAGDSAEPLERKVEDLIRDLQEVVALSCGGMPY